MMLFHEAIEKATDEIHDITEEITSTVQEERDAPAKAILRDVLEFVQSAAREKKLLGTNPEDTFESGLALLSEADQRLFVLRNTLEAMKRGEDPGKIVRHYQG